MSFAKFLRTPFYRTYLRDTAELHDKRQKSQEHTAVDRKKHFGCFLQRLKTAEVLDQ